MQLQFYERNVMQLFSWQLEPIASVRGQYHLFVLPLCLCDFATQAKGSSGSEKASSMKAGRLRKLDSVALMETKSPRANDTPFQNPAHCPPASLH